MSLLPKIDIGPTVSEALGESLRKGRYLLFAGLSYYPGSGAAGLIGAFSSLADCWDAVDGIPVGTDDDGDWCEGAFSEKPEWCHALDIQTGTIHARPGWRTQGNGESYRDIGEDPFFL